MTGRMQRTFETLVWLGAGVVVALLAPAWLLAQAALVRYEQGRP